MGVAAFRKRSAKIGRWPSFRSDIPNSVSPCCLRQPNRCFPAPQQADIPKDFKAPVAANDYVRREVMVPMRDGVKLYTVIVVPKGAKDAPILLTRTPYNASKRTSRNESTHMAAILPQGDEVFVAGGYIRVFQDVRGKYKSEGDYVMTRPVRGPLNPTATDHVTDAYDTIDWLVKNTPESNGRVGMIGSSYEGFTVVMALLGPHPALKVAAPESPMVDGWMGDDWFHYGAFRQTNFDYTNQQTTQRDAGEAVARDAYDDYEAFRRAGSAGAYARLHGLDQLPWAQKMIEHPAYDAFWQGQALGQTGGREAFAGADHVDSGPVGPGGHVGRDSKLPGAEGQRPGRSQLPGDGSVAAQPGELRRLQSGTAEMGWRHRAAIPPRRSEAVLRSISEGRRAQGRHAAGVHLQHRRESLGSFEDLAAGLREGLRGADEAALSSGGFRPGLRQARSSAQAPPTPTSPIPQSPCLTCRGPCASPIPTAGGSGW